MALPRAYRSFQSRWCRSSNPEYGGNSGESGNAAAPMTIKARAPFAAGCSRVTAPPCAARNSASLRKSQPKARLNVMGKSSATSTSWYQTTWKTQAASAFSARGKANRCRRRRAIARPTMPRNNPGSVRLAISAWLTVWKFSNRATPAGRYRRRLPRRRSHPRRHAGSLAGHISSPRRPARAGSARGIG